MGIEGFSYKLLTDYGNKLDERGREYLKRVHTSSQRLSKLVDDLLDFSRIRGVPINKENLNLSQIAISVSEKLRAQNPERKAEFIIAPNITGEGDRNLMQLVMENLLDNAWKFTSKHPNAKIEFGVIKKEGRPVYFVRDD